MTKASQPVTLVVLLLMLTAARVVCGATQERPNEHVSPPPEANPSAVVWRTPEPPSNAQAGDVWVNPKDQAEMVFVPAGEFLMGSTKEQVKAAMDEVHKQYPNVPDYWFTAEAPQHRVYLDAYWIDRYPVTVAQYRKFMMETGEGLLPTTDWEWQDDYPVGFVTWEQAAAYAGWAGKRLPTEAEWEKAARGMDGRQYPWGNAWDSGKCANSVGLGFGGLGHPQSVASHPAGASPYGCLEMAGNVWEWCADWYDARYYESAARANPSGPKSGSQRVQRGGCWGNVNSWDFRCARRFRSDPGPLFRIGSNGFRSARSATPGPTEAK